MMTRRLQENGTVSVLPTQANTLWHEDRPPVGKPPQYAEATREVAADALASQLEEYDAQHAVYLNAVPLIRGAGAEEVTRKLGVSGSWLRVEWGMAADAPAHARVERYLQDCGEEPFGMKEDVWKSLLQNAH